MDIFAAAMLGHVEIIQIMIEAFPDMRYRRGPHTISLLEQAKAGGAEAESVVEFLQGLLNL